ncbi:MAG: hypothetical protein C4522_19005 [Desulfobacteraceae bacterium]|nr:MAG: hypothetical protein C4522_19005 [Desulfobacteraceae bacterium]
MTNHIKMEMIDLDQYYGKILTGNYSKALKDKVTFYIQRLQLIDAIEAPVIIYLAAWQGEKKTIWYEFVNQQFTRLMGCSPHETSGAFRNSVIDRREYDYSDNDVNINERVIDKKELSGSRKRLRQETRKKGNTEAVYKLLFEKGRAVWLKDQASIESFQEDQIHLSLGCMTIVTKEMEAAEDKERIAEKLKQILAETGARIFKE